MNTLKHSTILFFLGIAAAACGPRGTGSTPLSHTDTIPVRLLRLETTDTASTIVGTGTFTTDDETVLSFKNGGVIQEIRVKEGDSFKSGQLLASLERTEVNTAVQQSRLVLEKASRDHQRAQQLYLDSVATLEQLENAETALKVAKEDAERAAYNLQHTSIHVPFDGYVLRRSANPGQVAGPGTPVLVVSGTGQSGWMLRIGVGDRQWSGIQLGDSAWVTRNATDVRPLRAVVQRKSEGVDPQSGTFSIFLKLVDDQLPVLASGMFGRAEIRLSGKTHSWLIPYEALLDGDAGNGYVFVTDDGRTARRVPVQIGSIEKDYVIIVGGLEHARSLIVSGSPYLQDGSPITVK